MKYKKIVSVPFGLAATSVGLGIAGDAFNSQGLRDAGSTAGAFISPSVSIAGGAIVIDQLKQLSSISKRRR